LGSLASILCVTIVPGPVAEGCSTSYDRSAFA
jgi:hypothetical protein